MLPSVFVRLFLLWMFVVPVVDFECILLASCYCLLWVNSCAVVTFPIQAIALRDSVNKGPRGSGFGLCCVRLWHQERIFRLMLENLQDKIVWLN